MKKIIQKLILSGFTAMMLFGFASSVFAVDPLNVIFTPDPLFTKPNFLPNDDAEGIVVVTNNSLESQTIITEAINAFDNDNLGSQLNITIEDISGVLYNDQLSDFLSTTGEVSLGTIASGATRTFTYTVAFTNTNDNDYQEKTLGFDVCVGFLGGNTHCGDTVAGGEIDTDGEGGGGGTGNLPPGGTNPGSGGGGGGGIILTISNEQANNLLPFTTATITWDTNLLSTSQVVYGPTPPSYTLDMNALYFGYPSGTVEDPIKVLHHSVLITGLTPGQTYVYRVVSRASPPTISFEKYFTVPATGSLLAQAGGNNFTGGSSGGNASVDSGGNSFENTGGFASDGVSSEENAALAEENSVDSNNNLAANALLSGFQNILSICSLIALLILLAIYMLWKLWLQKKYEKYGISEKEIWDRFYLFFGASSLLAVIISAIFSKYCPLPILSISFIISLVVYTYRKLKK